MKDKNYKFNSELLIKCRQERAIPRNYVCEKLNIAECSLFQWECGGITPNLLCAYKLAKFYGMNVEDFIIEKEK